MRNTMSVTPTSVSDDLIEAAPETEDVPDSWPSSDQSGRSADDGSFKKCVGAAGSPPRRGLSFEDEEEEEKSTCAK